MRGPDPLWSDSRAILIGVSVYQDERFPAVPAAANSLRGMERVLTDPRLCGWPADRVTVIANPSDSRDVAKTIRRLVQDTGDVLLLYYVGHGTLTATGELCLILSDTDAEAADLTSLEYARIRAAFRDSPARVKAAILDCCYSGRAIETLADESALLADHTDVRGVYTLTASDLAAHVPPSDERTTACTSFTGQFLDLVRTGIPGQDDPLTLGALYLHLRRRLRALGLPDPNQRGTDTAHSFAFTRNVAVLPPARPGEDDTQPFRARAHPSPETTRPGQGRPLVDRRRMLTVLGTAAAAAAATTAVIGIPAWLKGLSPDRSNGSGPPRATGSTQSMSPGPTLPAAFGAHLGRSLTGDPDMPINAVAAGVLNGKAVAVTGDGLPHGNPAMPDDPDQGSLRIWDLVGGTQLGPAMQIGSRVEAVALGTLGGQPIAVVGCFDNSVRVWNLEHRESIGPSLKATNAIIDVALGTLADGKDIAVALSLGDVRAWELREGTLIGAAIQMPERFQINDMELAQLRGKTVAVVGGYDHELRVWDVAKTESVGKALRHGKTIHGLAVSTLGGNPVAIASYGVGMRMWDLEEGKLIGKTFGDTEVTVIASGTLNGRPVVVADRVGGGIQVWDLTTREKVGDTLRSGDVIALTVTSINGVTVAVAATESTIRAWTLGPS